MTTTPWQLSGFGDEISPDPEVQVAVLLALGASHVEVRSAWGVNVVDLTDAQVDRLAAVLRGAGLGVSAVASPIGKVDIASDLELELARLRRVIAVATVLGTTNIRVFSFFRGPDVPVASTREAVLRAMSALAAEAAAAGVTLLHENEKDIYGDTPERVHDLVTAVDSPALRLAWDSANFVQVGVARPHDDGFELLARYVDYLQVKDAVAATGEVVPAGRGDGQVAATVRALRDRGYTGFVSLEPHLAQAHALGGFSGPAAFGEAARALADVLRDLGIEAR
ncbi:sugar phosphate isomerase/epimerase family protein [Litorihabitans aurantiacus]|uniref:Xylose isomerase n=1 Tax=Litorihabitans aurantiacus TaxID=1930061 RepID=A0AA37XGI3_9MICO|nr:sugar phosphate isomerase/epimerase family protein [Litorihabitans aurantiacus]GMA32556.1 xylose isomerase [Litorihabitans aurantiacus]